jgi:uncharacterized membrane protein YraQ (UPF0718 family)
MFPLAVLAMYAALLFFDPEKAMAGLRNAGNALSSMLFSLALVFVFMLIMNIFLKPAWVTKFLGKDVGIKGVIFSITAGIISTGPIYAWYPLLKELKEKGAGNHMIAIFLHNRSVKPFLLPVMISCFGFTYVVILVTMTIIASLAVGYALSRIVNE